MFQTILHIVLTLDLTAQKTNLQSVNNHIRLPRASLRRYLCNLDLKKMIEDFVFFLKSWGPFLANILVVMGLHQKTCLLRINHQNRTTSNHRYDRKISFLHLFSVKSTIPVYSCHQRKHTCLVIDPYDTDKFVIRILRCWYNAALL